MLDTPSSPLHDPAIEAWLAGVRFGAGRNTCSLGRGTKDIRDNGLDRVAYSRRKKIFFLLIFFLLCASVRLR